MHETDSTGNAKSTAGPSSTPEVDDPIVPPEPRVEPGKEAMKVPQEPSVVRSVTSISFSDPFTALLSDELTYENRTSSTPIDKIEIAKGAYNMDPEASLLANLKFFDSSRSRLELRPGYGEESDKLTEFLKQTIGQEKQQTIYMEYAHTFRHIRPGLKGRVDPRTLPSRLLFREPKFEFPFHLGERSTYVYAQPAPRLQLKFDKNRSTVPSSISTWIGPERRHNRES